MQPLESIQSTINVTFVNVVEVIFAVVSSSKLVNGYETDVNIIINCFVCYYKLLVFLF